MSESGFLTLYKPMEYREAGGKYEDHVFHYRLLDPRTEESGRKLPLLVWLHGLGEAGDDNVSQLHYLDTIVTPAPWKAGEVPFFVLAVQCPRDESWDSDDQPASDDMLSVLSQILDRTLDDFPIDRDRVYLSGVSAGGGGCWRFAARRPDYFAAVAPLSDGGVNLKRPQIECPDANAHLGVQLQ